MRVNKRQHGILRPLYLKRQLDRLNVYWPKTQEVTDRMLQFPELAQYTEDLFVSDHPPDAPPEELISLFKNLKTLVLFWSGSCRNFKTIFANNPLEKLSISLDRESPEVKG